jgi:hypothetical protein
MKMDRGRRFEAGSPAPGESDAVAKRRQRRAVMDDTRRKIERTLLVATAADELARAAHAVLMAAEAEQIDVNSMGFGALSTALARYREARGG